MTFVCVLQSALWPARGGKRNHRPLPSADVREERVPVREKMHGQLAGAISRGPPEPARTPPHKNEVGTHSLHSCAI